MGLLFGLIAWWIVGAFFATLILVLSYFNSAQVRNTKTTPKAVFNWVCFVGLAGPFVFVGFLVLVLGVVLARKRGMSL